MTDEAPSRWRVRPRDVPALALWLAGLAVLFIGSMLAARLLMGDGLSRVPVYVALIAGGYVLAVLVHESGHVLAALCSRMHIVQCTFHRFEAMRLRSGWRVRRGPRGPKPAASVRTFPRADNQSPRPWLVVAAAGPLASALLAATMAGIAPAFPIVALQPWLWGMAGYSGAQCVMALLPSVIEGRLSDGQIMRLQWSRSPEHAFELLVARRFGAMIDGVRASQVGAHDRQAMRDADPLAGPLFVASMELDEAMEAGEWSRAVVAADALDALIEAFPQPEAVRAKVSLVLLECGLVRTLASGDAVPLEASMAGLTPQARDDASWDSPWVIPRCEAVLAFLRGDAAGARAALAVSAQHAHDTVYASVRATEASVRAHIERWAASRTA